MWETSRGNGRKNGEMGKNEIAPIGQSFYLLTYQQKFNRKYQVDIKASVNQS